MKISTCRSVVLSLALVVGGLAWLLDTPAAEAQQPVRWKMASVVPASVPIVGDGAVYFTELLKKASRGRMQIKPYDPGKLVPATEVFGALSTGAVDAGWEFPCYWIGKNSATPLFCTVPFGPGMSIYLAWMYEGGGQQLLEEIYAKHNVWATPCLITPPEASGWFRKEVTSLDQFKGMKLRYPGIAGRVFQKLGASVQLIPAGEIYLALERGVIDATEFAQPSVDLALGFHQVAKHYYFPGWHQPSTIGNFAVNKAKWDALDEADRTLIKMACRDNIVRSISKTEAAQPAALAEIKKHGVKLHTWSPEFMTAFRKATDEVMAEMAAENPDFARVYKSQKDFRTRLDEWMTLSSAVR